MKTRRGWLVCCTVALMFAGGCKEERPTTPGGRTAVKVLLDWKPEPEFGGFYAAAAPGGADEQKQLLVTLVQDNGAGAPTWQKVVAGQSDFGTTAADRIILARSKGADIVAIFAVYQTCPQGVMVHAARGFKNLGDVFSHPGTLAADADAQWLGYCQNKFGAGPLTITGNASIAVFLSKPDYAMQCYVTSEPLDVKKSGSDPQTFLIADAGYNPYSTVLFTRGQLVREHPDQVKAMVEATRAGWASYLDDPTSTNATMHGLNPDMDAATFAAGAEAQKSLIETDPAHKDPLGAMTLERWQQLRDQMIQLKVIAREEAPEASACFVKL